MFIGFVAIDATLKFLVQVKDSSDVPIAPQSTPTYRVYGANGLMANGTGSLSVKETGAVTGATNASPIVITAASHGLTTGQKVTIASVGGNTAANGTWSIILVDANSFSLTTSTGNGSYTSGGTWTTTGLYEVSLTPTTANGFAAGGWYDVLVVITRSSDMVINQYRFGVV